MSTENLRIDVWEKNQSYKASYYDGDLQVKEITSVSFVPEDDSEDGQLLLEAIQNVLDDEIAQKIQAEFRRLKKEENN